VIGRTAVENRDIRRSSRNSLLTIRAVAFETHQVMYLPEPEGDYCIPPCSERKRAAPRFLCTASIAADHPGVLPNKARRNVIRPIGRDTCMLVRSRRGLY
jgi:hypothetical protein